MWSKSYLRTEMDFQYFLKGLKQEVMSVLTAEKWDHICQYTLTGWVKQWNIEQGSPGPIVYNCHRPHCHKDCTEGAWAILFRCSGSWKAVHSPDAQKAFPIFDTEKIESNFFVLVPTLSCNLILQPKSTFCVCSDVLRLPPACKYSFT